MDKVQTRVISKGGLKQIRKALGPSGRNSVLREIGYRLKAIIQENFGAEGPWRPEEWPPYAHDYPKYGKFEGEPATLIRTGKLGRSIRVTITDDYAEITADADYASSQQFGTGSLPARPFLPIHGDPSGYTLIPEVQAEVEAAAYKVFMREMKKI